MSVRELTSEEMVFLKVCLLMENLDKNEGRSPSWGELAVADELVSDEEVFAAYEGTVFSPDDFI